MSRYAPRMPVRLAVFDLDGTLADTMEDIAASMDAMLRNEGLPIPAREAYSAIVGDGARVAVSRATDGRFDDDDEALERLTESYLAAYRVRGVRSARAYTGVEAMLDRLDGAVMCAVLTNKPHDLAIATMEALFGGRRFARVEGVRRGWMRKPDPGGLLEIIRDSGVRIEEAMMIGDTNTDIRTGRAAGVETIGVSWGFRGENELRTEGATHIAHHPADVVEILGGLLRE